MKKEKYYYSEDLHLAKMDVIINNYHKIVATGEIGEYKSLPRVTICGVYDNEAQTMTYGVAICSEKDTFKRKIGQTISYNRAFTKPYRVVQIHPSDKISELFITHARQIECEVLGSRRTSSNE